jgi:hypothetical protein
MSRPRARKHRRCSGSGSDGACAVAHAGSCMCAPVERDDRELRRVDPERLPHLRARVRASASTCARVRARARTAR